MPFAPKSQREFSSKAGTKFTVAEGMVLYMKNLYLITGADGHLGGTIIRMLISHGEKIRGLILPSGSNEHKEVEYFRGDVTRKNSLRPFFENTSGYRVILIHTAGIVDISGKNNKRMYVVNIGGTQNIVDMCFQYKVNRFVYVSSVHAIPE